MTYETLFIGVLVAVLYVEIFGVYPGGIIVPAYIALYLDQPLRVLVTVAIAVLCVLVYRILSRYVILFGKRRFVTFIFIGAVLAQAWTLLFPQIFPESFGLRAIGWLIPGLLANNLEKQRFLPTLTSLVTVAVFTYVLIRMLQHVFP
ncbi:MAG: poly-gamma-glutamate biosynthesis protein PgsC [Candidatus Aminicenantes bacterium]|jgi:poly-gamma-glutamate biosynthesis protein PgsC/CapC